MTPARDCSAGSCSLTFQPAVRHFSGGSPDSTSDEFVAERPQLKAVIFQDDVAASWSCLLDGFPESIYWLSNLLVASRILLQVLIGAGSKVQWMCLSKEGYRCLSCSGLNLQKWDSIGGRSGPCSFLLG